MGLHMFKHLLREMDALKNTTSISVPIEADREGYCDKECPAQNCLFDSRCTATTGKILCEKRKCSARRAATLRLRQAGTPENTFLG